MEFYNKRNGSKQYSKKLNQQIKNSLDKILNNPQIGIATQEADVRVLIVGNYEVVYQISQQQIVVVMIWDSRQNPENQPVKRS